MFIKTTTTKANTQVWIYKSTSCVGSNIFSVPVGFFITLYSSNKRSKVSFFTKNSFSIKSVSWLSLYSLIKTLKTPFFITRCLSWLHSVSLQQTRFFYFYDAFCVLLSHCCMLIINKRLPNRLWSKNAKNLLISILFRNTIT